MMSKHILAAVALTAMAACTTTSGDGRQTLVTREGVAVLHNGVAEPFEARFKAGYSAPDYWCAAARFAENQRLGIGTDIYRLTPTPRPQGSGMVFSFTRPPGGGQPTGLVVLGGDSGSLSFTAAREQCRVVQQRIRQRN